MSLYLNSEEERKNPLLLMKKLLIFLTLLPAFAYSQYDVELEELATGFSSPSEIVNAGDERLFVVEQAGIIKILYTDGTQEPTPFLNISSQVNSGGEKGLLGLAFAPDYCTSGKFYVNYTFNDSIQLKTRISQFSVNPENENDALENSEEILLEFNQPFSNHNGGQVEFGPDGYLYIGTGDGGSGGDPDNYAQNDSTYLGKLLRIDVSTLPYTIPADNPFVNDPTALPEIWAYGLRNPWKFAFDTETGDLFIADVGQSELEEVDFQPAGAAGGANYGWRCYEGTDIFNTSQCADNLEVVDPVFEYGHAGGNCSITGGRVYRGTSFSNIIGKYISVDLCSGNYWLVWQEGGEWQSFAGGLLGGGIVAFGEDVWGEMYAVRSGTGTISRVVESSGELVNQIILNGADQAESLLEGESYAWYLDGEIIEGATDQIITVPQPGVYTVVITTATGCEVQSNSVNITTVGVSDHKSIKVFNVFPNPATDLLNLEIELNESSIDGFQIAIFSIDGKEVLKASSNVNSTFSPIIDVRNLKNGIYFLQCRNSNGETLATRKIVIN